MKTKSKNTKIAAKSELVFDVVCGMELEKATVSQRARLHGITYYFCANHCKRHFENNPERYVWEQEEVL